MTITTVAGPFKTRQEAIDTAKFLGNQSSVFGKYKTDAEGYTSDEYAEWFVECDDSIQPDRIFGYDAAEFMARQYRR
jgi:hypothetical protein